MPSKYLFWAAGCDLGKVGLAWNLETVCASTVAPFFGALVEAGALAGLAESYNVYVCACVYVCVYGWIDVILGRET